VTLDKKVPKLNSRPFYCSRLYGIQPSDWSKLNLDDLSDIMADLVHIETNSEEKDCVCCGKTL
jgi:hypothetical protein